MTAPASLVLAACQKPSALPPNAPTAEATAPADGNTTPTAPTQPVAMTQIAGSEHCKVFYWLDNERGHSVYVVEGTNGASPCGIAIH